MTTDYE